MKERLVRVLSATVVAIAVTTSTPGAYAAHDRQANAAHVGPQMKHVKFEARFTEPLPTTDGAGCDGLSAPPPGCGLYERSTSTFEAPFAGTSKVSVVGRFSAMTQKYHFTGTQTFSSVTITGCGEGGLVLEMYDGEIDPARFNPATRQLPGKHDWRIREGSGTQRLAQAIGGGTASWTMLWDNAATGAAPFVEGTLTGAIDCLR